MQSNPSLPYTCSHPQNPHPLPVFHHPSIRTRQEMLLLAQAPQLEDTETPAGCRRGSKEMIPSELCVWGISHIPASPRGERTKSFVLREWLIHAFFQASPAKPWMRTELTAERVSSTAHHTGLPFRGDAESQTHLF